MGLDALRRQQYPGDWSMPEMDMDDWYAGRPYNIPTIDLTTALSALQGQRDALAPDPFDGLNASAGASFMPGPDIHEYREEEPPAVMAGEEGGAMDMGVGLDDIRSRFVDQGGDAMDPFAEFQNRVLGAGGRLREAAEARRRAHAAALERLSGMRGRANYGPALLAFAGEAMQPSKSGHPFESIGRGVSALSSGLGAAQQQDRDLERLIAQAEMQGADREFGTMRDIENFDLSALATNAKLKAAQEKLQLVKDRATKDPAGPLEKQIYDWIQTLPEDQREKAMQFHHAVRGTSQIKNAQAMGGDGQFADTVSSLVMSPEWRGYLAQAEKMFPEEALQGVPLEQRNKMIFGKAMELAGAARKAAPAATAAGVADAGGGAMDQGIGLAEVAARQGLPQAGAPAPTPASSGVPAPSAGRSAAGQPRIQVPAAKPGAIPDKAQEAARKKAAESNVEMEQKRLEGQPAALKRVRSTLDKTDNVLERVNRSFELMDDTNLGTTGVPGRLLKDLPGTDAKSLKETLGTIKANLGFQALQEMREMSPTGGALGQVAIQELEALQSAVASLDQDQKGEDVRKNLEKIRQHYNNWRNATVKSYKEQYPDFQDRSTDLERQSQFKIIRKVK